MKIKITIRKDKVNSIGHAPVIIQISENKTVSRIAMGFTVLITDYDESKQLVKSTNKNWKALNEKIKKAKKDIEKAQTYFNSYLLDNDFKLNSNSEATSNNEIFKKIYKEIESGVNLESKLYGIEYRAPASSLESRMLLDIRVPLSKRAQATNLVRKFLKNERDADIAPFFGRVIDESTPEEIKVKNDYFIECWNKYYKYCLNEKRASTASRIPNNYNILLHYTIDHNLDLNFGTMTEDFGIEFRNYLLYEYLNIYTKKRGVSNGTVHNIQKSISAFLNWAFKKGYNTNLQFKRWDTKKPKTHLQYLNPFQLEAVFKFPIPIGSSLDRSRDLWVFSAYSGMRWSDVQNWIPSNLNDGMIVYRSVKARKDCMVGVNEVTTSILKKYGGSLPKQNAALVNKNIKEVLTLLGYDDIKVNRILSFGKEDRIKTLSLSQAITFHSARRSFINLMISKNTGVVHLSTMVGNDVNSLMVYYKADKNHIKRIMDDITLFE